MQKYLALRQINQVGYCGSYKINFERKFDRKGVDLILMQGKDTPEVEKKVAFCLRVMSRSFADPEKAEESFQILDQLQDANIWKILTDLVDPNTSFHQTRVYGVI